MLALLNEDESSSGKSKSKKTKENDENEGMQKKSDLSPFSGMTLLNGLSFKSGIVRKRYVLWLFANV